MGVDLSHSRSELNRTDLTEVRAYIKIINKKQRLCALLKAKQRDVTLEERTYEAFVLLCVLPPLVMSSLGVCTPSNAFFITRFNIVCHVRRCIQKILSFQSACLKVLNR